MQPFGVDSGSADSFHSAPASLTGYWSYTAQVWSDTLPC